MQHAFDGGLRRVAEFGADGQFGGLVLRVELRGHEGIAHGHGPAGSEEHFLPDAHVFVRRSGIPIHPGDAEVVFFGREDFERQGIRGSRLQELGDVEFVGAVGARDVVRVGNFLTVDPDVGAVVDTEKIQPDVFARVHG